MFKIINDQLVAFNKDSRVTSIQQKFSECFSSEQLDIGKSNELLTALRTVIHDEHSFETTQDNDKAPLRLDDVCYRAAMVTQYYRLKHYWHLFSKQFQITEDEKNKKNEKKDHISEAQQQWNALENHFTSDLPVEEHVEKKRIESSIDNSIEYLAKHLKQWLDDVDMKQQQVNQYTFETFCHEALLLLGQFKCYGQDDVLSGEVFAKIPKRYIITTVSLHQFELDWITKWFQKQTDNSPKDPYNQQPFHPKDLANIKAQAKKFDLELEPPVISIARVERQIRQVSTFVRILDNENPYTYIVKSILYYFFIFTSIASGLVAGVVFWFSLAIEIIVDLVLSVYCLLGARWPQGYRVGNFLFGSFWLVVIICTIPALLIAVLTLPVVLPLIASVAYLYQLCKAFFKQVVWQDVLEYHTQVLMTLGLTLGVVLLVVAMVLVFALFLAPHSFLAGVATSLGIKALALHYASVMQYTSYTTAFADMCVLVGGAVLIVPLMLSAFVAAIVDSIKVIRFVQRDQTAAQANETKFKRILPRLRAEVLALPIDTQDYEAYYPLSKDYSPNELQDVINRHRDFLRRIERYRIAPLNDNLTEFQQWQLTASFHELLIVPAENDRLQSLTSEQREQQQADYAEATRLQSEEQSSEEQSYAFPDVVDLNLESRNGTSPPSVQVVHDEPSDRPNFGVSSLSRSKPAIN